MKDEHGQEPREDDDTGEPYPPAYGREAMACKLYKWVSGNEVDPRCPAWRTQNMFENTFIWTSFVASLVLGYKIMFCISFWRDFADTQNQLNDLISANHNANASTALLIAQDQYKQSKKVIQFVASFGGNVAAGAAFSRLISKLMLRQNPMLAPNGKMERSMWHMCRVCSDEYATQRDQLKDELEAVHTKEGRRQMLRMLAKSGAAHLLPQLKKEGLDDAGALRVVSDGDLQRVGLGQGHIIRLRASLAETPSAEATGGSPTVM